MECDICSREYTPRRKPLCASCVQAILYASRHRQVTSLLDREESHTYAEAVIRPGNDGILASLPANADFDAITTGVRKYSYDRTLAERNAADHRIEQIVDKAEELKQQMERYKQHIATQKEHLQRRRQDLASEKEELQKHKPRALDPVESATKKASQRLDKTRTRVVDARLLLCREAASASNLQKRKGANGRSEYTLGGIHVPDLRELNTRTQASSRPKLVGGRVVVEPHGLVSESFDNVARLINLSAHYLSVRLPAEIILAHEDFPRAVIMPEKSSYKFKNLPFPGISGSQSSSPVASRVLDQNLPRTRPLWLDRPLAQLVKEDGKQFGLFIEGVTLLAWNLAWLCKTQGIETINTFEDVCNIGRNLWTLLMSQHRRSRSTKEEPTRLGIFSHASAENNLFSLPGIELMKDWQAHSPARIGDKLKSFLITEISGADWDLLEGREWDEEREDEVPVLVGGLRRPQDSRHAAAMSIMSFAQPDGAEDERATSSAAEGKRAKKNSGYVKVRGRNNSEV
ncbi:hypothetical protein BST61_czeina129g000210 [Lecanosticta acicola]|uniref:Autophagy-related protein 14 n=1 Tax=Lecanosticta acicola TaxID=111012 RepID=A0AAI9ECS5_9PEZI|nr:hypothetical protein BST61_czeina129g000210 [Lecanosticta acicola]